MNKNKIFDRGVVTLADENYFNGLELLYVSVQQSCPMPVVCYDIGLSDAQKIKIKDEYTDLHVLPIPDNYEYRLIRESFKSEAPLAKINKRVWPLWICPFLISDSPFRRVFWIDSDILVLRNLSELFSMLDKGPVFTPENNSPEMTPNRSELYSLLPILRDFNISYPNVNAGVSGWDLERDSLILEAYKYPVLTACYDIDVRRSISWHDQGALIWAIQSSGVEDRVVNTWKWNLCVKHTCLSGVKIDWNYDAIDFVRKEVPDANLLHWNGQPMPWL